MGWNISEERNVFSIGLKYFWRSCHSQWVFILLSSNIHNVCSHFLKYVAIFTIGLKYVYNWVEIYSQLGWNISENPTDHSGTSFFEVGGSKRGSKMNIHNFFEIFLENLNMISIGLKYFWRSCPSQYVFIFWSGNIHNVCLHFFHNISGFVLISEYNSWWLPIFKITIFEELVIQWSSNSWINFLSKF